MRITPTQIPNFEQIGSLNSLRQTTPAKATDSVTQAGETFNQVLTSLSQTENNSNNLLSQLAAGENVDLHNVMIATEQTDISFKVAMGIRDKLVEAYREMMRITV
jgi:flagellar hook-basal body complex protein FliE